MSHSSSLLKQKAQELRKKGRTYSQIQTELNLRVPKSTLSYWCKNIELPNWYMEELKTINTRNIDRARAIALFINRSKRKEYLESLLKRNIHLLSKLDAESQKIMLSILYLGEGTKHKSAQVLTLGNTNPTIIMFYLTLLKNCYNIDEAKLRARIQCRFDQNKKKLEKFWQNLIQISGKQFYPTYIDKRTENKPTKKKDYKGICTIYYFSTEIQLELELLAEAIMGSILKGR